MRSNAPSASTSRPRAATRRCSTSIPRSSARGGAPAAAQRLEDGDLVLGQGGVGGGDGGVGGDQRLLGGQEFQLAERPGQILAVGEVEGAADAGLWPRPVLAPARVG